ncbi:MAG: 3-deoxy-manno-octulosonate cytidylyltransferase [Candidatus Liberibacter ctenarytainae]|uniref:3-deoxy-manno-octulosonate cytidylyltransferase n=1 Tax=Candidatus Liberibacter ctenarytainae TaxID=2020335 RepID=A0A937DLL8_9HYPH|nr:3-deoxy-manno-octulosonate cytidylyltransferase [Candidatus Liberibacter ctenarytainae]
MTNQNPEKVLIIIPARLQSKRFPEKVLANINGIPMILHTASRARKANIGRVIIAVDHEKTRNIVSSAGFESVMTQVGHVSGSDRISEAVDLIDPKQTATIIVNMQGDIPNIEPENLSSILVPLKDPQVDIGTIASEISDNNDLDDINIVKIVTSSSTNGCLRSLYFTRSKTPYGIGPFYKHIGIYAYRRKALQYFTKLPPSTLEKRESLEQLRALENNMRIDVKIVKSNAISVDMPYDLEQARILMAHSNYDNF